MQKQKKSRWRRDLTHFERAFWKNRINPYLKILDSRILEEALIVHSMRSSNVVNGVVDTRKGVELTNFNKLLYSDIHLGLVLKKIDYYEEALKQNWEDYLEWECRAELEGKENYSEYLSLKAKRGNLISKIRTLNRISTSVLGPHTPFTIGLSKNFKFN